MKIAVCVKQVPDTESRLRVAKDGRWIEDEDLPYVLNESDEYAIEEALRWTEKLGGEVVVFSLGPDRVKEALRKSLALGAARAVHIKEAQPQGGNALATGRILASALARESFDLILTGSQSEDVGSGATGSLIAGHLGWPHAWLVMGIEIESPPETARITREMESGLNEVCRLALPAVLQVQAGINTPRYPSLKGIMAAKRKTIEEVSAEALGIEPGLLVADSARLEILSVGFPQSSAATEIITGDAATAAKQLVEKLQREARVI